MSSGMASDFNARLNSDEIKSLISQLSADDLGELTSGLENWLEEPATDDSEARSPSETRDRC